MPDINQIRVSISEAARLFGIDTKTIRRAIKAQEIRYIVVRNRYKLNFESLIKWSQRKTTVRNKSNSSGIGQYVEKWKINNKLYAPNPPKSDTEENNKSQITSSK
jgi:excisionase family DNA binding protein